MAWSPSFGQEMGGRVRKKPILLLEAMDLAGPMLLLLVAGYASAEFDQRLRELCEHGGNSGVYEAR